MAVRVVHLTGPIHRMLIDLKQNLNQEMEENLGIT